MRRTLKCSLIFTLILMSRVALAADQQDADDAYEAMDVAGTAAAAEKLVMLLKRGVANTRQASLLSRFDAVKNSMTEAHKTACQDHLDDAQEDIDLAEDHRADGDSDWSDANDHEDIGDSAYMFSQWASAVAEYNLAEGFFCDADDDWVLASDDYEAADPDQDLAETIIEMYE